MKTGLSVEGRLLDLLPRNNYHPCLGISTRAVSQRVLIIFLLVRRLDLVDLALFFLLVKRVTSYTNYFALVPFSTCNVPLYFIKYKQLNKHIVKELTMNQETLNQIQTTLTECDTVDSKLHQELCDIVREELKNENVRLTEDDRLAVTSTSVSGRRIKLFDVYSKADGIQEALSNLNTILDDYGFKIVTTAYMHRFGVPSIYLEQKAA